LSSYSEFLNLHDVFVLVLGAQGGKYKYEYKYSGFVLDYNLSTGTSTKYYISAYGCRPKFVSVGMGCGLG